MAQTVERSFQPNGMTGWRIASWGGAAGLLMIPAVGVWVSDEWQWGAGDFLLIGGLLAIACAIFELVARQSDRFSYRLATAVAMATGFMLLFVNVAVGLIGDEDNPANLLFAALLAGGAVGALAARFRPAGLAKILLAMAAAQFAIGVAAYAFRLGADGRGWPLDVIGGNLLFTILWLLAAFLYRLAARPADGHDERRVTP